MAKFFEHIVTVQGAGSFPIDMLRYDGLAPHREWDSGEIRRHVENADAAATTIELSKISWKAWRPNVDRWRSFGWHVFSHHVEREIKA